MNPMSHRTSGASIPTKPTSSRLEDDHAPCTNCRSVDVSGPLNTTTCHVGALSNSWIHPPHLLYGGNSELVVQDLPVNILNVVQLGKAVTP